MGSRIVYIYPKEFNLIEKNYLIIRYITKNPQYIKNLRLYPTAPDLECTDLNMMKKCTISLNYFLKNNIYDKYYYTYYLNNTGGLSIFYDIPMINVTLPSKEDIIDIFVRDNDNKGSYYVGEKGMLFFIGDYSDSETKIFTPSGIEEKIVFNTSVTDENYNNYDVTCKLWQPLKIFDISVTLDVLKLDKSKYSISSQFSNIPIIFITFIVLKILIPFISCLPA